MSLAAADLADVQAAVADRHIFAAITAADQLGPPRTLLAMSDSETLPFFGFIRIHIAL